MATVQVTVADYQNPQHAKDIVHLLHQYALDPMGGGNGISTEVQGRLVSELAQVPGAFSILCYVDSKPAGLANCFMGFSTFKGKPLVNIHDLAVMPGHRGAGLSQRLLEKVEAEAKDRGACKVTLEVLTGNHIAQQAYLKYGFAGYALDEKMGHAVFWEKPL
ncbi:GNAT family N-acetyltransferase [Alteromonadaceae bacterium BrNp21-10]|nr:GNAT family N-acetyltransferase [Alteromonadaceae bacterium BrNp21-10]